MTTLDYVGTVPSIRAGISMIALAGNRWRITRTTGEVLGYIEGFDDVGGRRFAAKRLLSAQARSIPLGEFWDLEDAIDGFRFS